MVFQLFSTSLFDVLTGRNRRARKEIAFRLYTQISEKSRQPVFYTDMGVPDTIDGRFDMLLIELFLLIHRFKKEFRGAHEKEAIKINQAVFDLTFIDMDQNLRQIGIGDSGVPRHIKNMAKAFYGRATVYQNGIEQKDNKQILIDALTRNLYAHNKDKDKIALYADKMADYMIEQDKVLEKIPFETLINIKA